MAWVKFTAEHWHRFNAQMKRRYLAGQVLNVPAPVARKAIADGHAVAMRKPSKTAKPEPADDELVRRISASVKDISKRLARIQGGSDGKAS